MPKNSGSFSTITGDVEAVSEVTVNTKGGSMTATLKKSLREKFGGFGGRLLGAALQFANGQAIVLLVSGSNDAQTETSVRVHRRGENRFEIELDTGEGEEEIDDVQAAFLMLKESRFKTHDLLMLQPVTAIEWRAEMDEKLSAARSAADQHTRPTKVVRE